MNKKLMMLTTVALVCFGTSDVYAGKPSSGGGSGGAGNGVPELSTTYRPIALALIAGIVLVGLEVRRRKRKD